MPARTDGAVGGVVEILDAAGVSPDGWGLAVSVLGVLVPRDAEECWRLSCISVSAT